MTEVILAVEPLKVTISGPYVPVTGTLRRPPEPGPGFTSQVVAGSRPKSVRSKDLPVSRRGDVTFSLDTGDWTNAREILRFDDTIVDLPAGLWRFRCVSGEVLLFDRYLVVPDTAGVLDLDSLSVVQHG